MHTKLRSLTVFVALIALSAPPAGVPADSGTTNFFLGSKKVRGLGSRVSGQGEIGVEMSFGRIDWPIKVAVDVMGAGNLRSLIDDYTYVYSYYDPYTMTSYNYYYDYEGVDALTTTFEVDLGVRKVWEFDHSNIRPYVGGGPAFISASTRLSDPDDFFFGGAVSDSDLGVGWWAGGGVFWRLGEKLNLGVNARYSTAKVEFTSTGDSATDALLFGGSGARNRTDVGGAHIGLLLGWGW